MTTSQRFTYTKDAFGHLNGDSFIKQTEQAINDTAVVAQNLIDVAQLNLTQLQGYVTQAQTAATNASACVTDAESARDTANQYKTAASTSATNASTSATNASTSEDNAETWAEGTDAEVEALGGTHSAKKWAEISIVAQADYAETVSGSTSYIRNKPVIDTTTSASSTNAVTNAAVTTRINEIWSWIYNQSGWSPILTTTSGVDLMTSTTEVVLADHA